MKSAQISRLEIPGNPVRQKAEASSKTTGHFKTMLDGINSLNVNNPSTLTEPLTAVRPSPPSATQPAATVRKEKAIEAYRHDRFIPLKTRRPVSTDDSSVQESGKPPRNYSYRIASKKEISKATGAGTTQSSPPATFAEAVGKIKGWLTKIFSASQPGPSTLRPKEHIAQPPKAKEVQEKPQGFFAKIAHFFKNLGKKPASSESTSKPSEDLQVCSGTESTEDCRKIGSKRNDAEDLAAGGQNFPDGAGGTEPAFQMLIENLQNNDAMRRDFENALHVLGKRKSMAMHRTGRVQPHIEDEADSIEGLYPGSTNRIHRAIRESAKRYQLPADLVAAVIKVESNFDPRAVSPKGARGLMQLMPATARELEVRNSFNVEQNIDAGCRYLRYLLDEFDGEVRMALAAYNAGPGAVKKYQGIPPYRETRQYLNKVLSHLYARS